MHKIGRDLVIGWEVFDSYNFSAVIELRRIAHCTIACELKATVEPIEQIERLGGEFEFPTIS
jgi:hypothetical protein